MTTLLGLMALTVLELDPAEQVSCAAATGYGWVSVRLIPATPHEPQRDTAGDTQLIRETRQRADDLGIPVLDVETLRIKPDTDVRDYEVYLATGAQLGARSVAVAGMDDDRSRLADNYHQLAELAHTYGLAANVEFMPWTEVKGVRDAAQLLAEVDHPATGLAVDSIHFDRSGSTPEELAALPKSWRKSMHLCDAPTERPTTTDELIHQARHARQIPGQGGLDLHGQLQAMATDAMIALEVPLQTPSPVPAEKRAADVLTGARTLLAQNNR
ncbi:sugar phosphate isomerase/epimerase family protein [Saccharopolyspora hattusasensis]|uniref:sugar phosphate isomerase/epimerase family protein n=1 Tax=Saccharopolyspora hattusasensis TaxID=1128679 RepID=UPI003D996FB9